MIISGQVLPASRQITHDSQAQDSSDPRRERQVGQQKRQQPVEFIFRGDVEDEFGNNAQQRVPNFEQISPANRGAIFSYHNTASASIELPQRSGGLVDIFL